MKHSSRAFNLIEVVIAIGILSFAIISMLGLMSAGMRGSQRSSNDLALGLMTQSVLAALRVQGFTNVAAASGYAPGHAGDNFFFNYDGNLAVDSTNGPLSTPAADTYYACAVSRNTNAAWATTNAFILRLVFSWPQQAAAINRQQRVVLASMVNNE